MADGSILFERFILWYQKVKRLCLESGHYDVGILNVGKVLIYSPADDDGLWINRKVAELLDSEENDYIRIGFSEAVFNSRGAHFVDPAAKPELELANKFSEQADALDLCGFSKFAETVRSLAHTYEQEAKRIIEEHEGG